MAEPEGDLRIAWLTKSIDEVDREVARLAMLCKVRILEPGVIERVLHNDASVCGTNNPVAFDKLRNMLMMHYAVRTKAVGVVGEVQTEQIIAHVVERLKKHIGDALGDLPRG
jgi:hypothetical protein